jgi:trehalose-phosphatase
VKAAKRRKPSPTHLRGRVRRRKPKLFARGWPEIVRRLRGARRLLLMLDFDGTLTPLRERPRSVQLARSARALLGRLARRPNTTVWVISGRSLADLRGRVHVPGVHCLGVHGWEGLPGARMDARSRRTLRRARRALRGGVAFLPKIRMEDKHISFAVHYRGASPPAVRRARRALRETLRPYAESLRVLEGKKVWEVLPRAIKGKGAAVRALLARHPSALPVYIGDDTTDEEAFRVLRRGITIRVGPGRNSRAQYFARNPAEVIRFLSYVETVAG